MVQISEFMASNVDGLDDEDRDEEDWIEIHNAGTDTINLEGWYLTDDRDRLTRWPFPRVILEPDDYLVVFASGKNRRDPAGVLHTNFKLSSTGEYLGLVRPDGITVAAEFAPAFPIQAPDISYGLSENTAETVLLALEAPAKALVPQDDALEPRGQRDAPRPWTLEDFDDSAWPAGTTGVGFGYPGLVGLDVSAMRNVNETVYVRIPFVVDDPSMFKALTLRMWHDDGMIAYINGHEVARDNAPAPTEETWNSGAPAMWPSNRTARSVDFTIPRFDFLHVGTNLLAVQGLNNGVTSSDLLVRPELRATVLGAEQPRRYFPVPTPGQPNSAGVEVLGPIITDPNHSPALPTERDNLQITVRISPSFEPVASVQLRYRVMYDAEAAVPMLDDGQNGDGAAGDGVYGARIFARSLFHAGEMVRWMILAMDTAGRESRFPSYLDPLKTPQYCGTIVADPSLTNPLPVLHWFIQNPTAANTDAGTRCSLFYDGEFYDNVGVYIHGQSSRSFPKKSYNIDLNRGHNFKWAKGQSRADDINLMTTFPDKAQMRNILAYETYREAGAAHHWVFPVRVQQNAAFWGTAHLMENGDEDWLVRMGINTEGVLYKMYNTFTSVSHATSSVEKKTRKNEDNQDLIDLFTGISLSGEPLRVYLYDNVDIPAVVNFLAARTLTGDTDCCHKNYYFYRDTHRSGEWQMWPWDVDLSFGRVWNSAQTYWNQVLITNTALFTGNNNRLPQVIFSTPELRQMYLRRLRTLMDELLRSTPATVIPPAPTPAPGPPPRPRPQGNAGAKDDSPLQAAAEPNAAADLGYYERRIDELAAQIGPDAALDNAKWNSHAWGNGSTTPSYPQPYAEAVAELRNAYLPERRHQLFDRLTSGAAEIPAAQPVDTVIWIVVAALNPAGGNPDEGYVQLLNPNAYAVDISGWTLVADGNTKSPLFTFRGGTVIPAGGTLYVAANRVAFRARRLAPSGGQALLVVGDYGYRLPVLGQTFELFNRQGVKATPAKR
jgi:hypothetical protein